MVLISRAGTSETLQKSAFISMLLLYEQQLNGMR